MKNSIIALSLIAASATFASAAGASKGGFAAARYSLELDGVLVGQIEKVAGGSVASDVVSGKTGADAKKHVGNVKYEPFTLTFSGALDKKVTEWISNALEGKDARHDGAIVASDMNGKAGNRREFTQALLSQVQFPSVDASSKDMAKLTVKISPESIKDVSAAAGKTVAIPTGASKKWLASNFKLDVPGLDCSKVEVVDALPFDRKTVSGGKGPLATVPEKLDPPNLIIKIPAADAKAFEDWHTSEVTKGGAPHGDKSGSLSYLDDAKQTLLKLSFDSLGISKLTPEKGADGKVANDKIEMYFEKASLSAQ